MFDTPMVKYRPTRSGNNFGSEIVPGSGTPLWGDVERNAQGTLEIQVNADEDVVIGDILVLET